MENINLKIEKFKNYLEKRKGFTFEVEVEHENNKYKIEFYKFTRSVEISILRNNNEMITILGSKGSDPEQDNKDYLNNQQIIKIIELICNQLLGVKIAMLELEKELKEADENSEISNVLKKIKNVVRKPNDFYSEPEKILFEDKLIEIHFYTKHKIIYIFEKFNTYNKVIFEIKTKKTINWNHMFSVIESILK